MERLLKDLPQLPSFFFTRWQTFLINRQFATTGRKESFSVQETTDLINPSPTKSPIKVHEGHNRLRPGLFHRPTMVFIPMSLLTTKIPICEIYKTTSPNTVLVLGIIKKLRTTR
ncbi:uncharacterized protein OCT59_010497 [Rhizophagus irregularis]|uniref:uncharacterized protein n=1 Tax=Rhizophagus irregularis TaxID=588596 RepID=UPI0019FC1C4E|nr:hypothetical protein OCT59_010497 [Rhizophagus irregularis]GBC29926.2 hypothetical protein RIR_jg23662.t1 [Rhizophagus irregularis DAOM 181602=DAOM 197198]